VKLMDFGIAAMVDSQKLTLTGQLLGSPAYMAPEMITGGRLDFRTDLFSLGILLYRLTVGELPFKGRTPHEVLKRIADAEYIRPGIANPRVGDDLAEIIGKTLARDPEARYQDAEQLLAALEAHLARLGVAELCGNAAEVLRDPAAFEQRCRPRLLEQLLRLAEADIAAGRLGPAFSTLNRVLAFEPEHPVVHRLLRTLNRRQGLRSLARTAILVAGVAVLAALLVLGFQWLPLQRTEAPPPRPPDAALVALTAPAEDAGITTAPPPVEDAEAPGQSVFDGSLVAPVTGDAGAAAGDRRDVRPHVAPGRPAPGGPRSFAFKIQPPIWRAFLDGRAISPSPGQPLQYDVPPGDHTLVFRSDIAYDHVVNVAAGQPATAITGRLRWKPARLLVQANPSAARVQFKSPPYLERSVFPKSGELVMIPLPADRDPPFSARIMVYAERYQAEYRDIALVPNQLTNVTVKLTPLP
jgi:serine/threonine-protein kinase